MASAPVAERDTLSGLDALELAGSPPRGGGVWSGLWPKLAALGIGLLAWQAVVWTGWRPEYVLPGPATVLPRLWEGIADGQLVEALGMTMRRAVVGYGLALVVGTAIGVAVAQSRVLRAAIGSLITGLQTMPSIAWFPLAILLFRLSDAAILFVVVIGAAPSIANGLLSGIDNIPPLLLRAGRVLGARGVDRYRHVVLPAALPGFVAGLKQGWAFAWRSLLAGELLVIIANETSLGRELEFSRELSDAPGLIATMIAILVVGIVIDAFGFGALERSILRRRGLLSEPH